MKAATFSICFLFLPFMGNADDIDNSIKRLDKHIQFLVSFNKNNYQHLKVNAQSKSSLYEFDIVDYKHELVRLCLKGINIKASFEPLFKTWSLFNSSFKEVETDCFVKEFGILIFCVYKNLIKTFIKSESKVSSAEIIELAGKIRSLPIEQVLDALDLCYRRFIFIMQDYGLSQENNPKEWLKHYWWVIPVSLFSLAISVVKHYVYNPLAHPNTYVPRKDGLLSITSEPDIEQPTQIFKKTL